MMSEFWSKVVETAQAMSGWEVAAVVLALAYLVLAIQQSQWCWYAAFASTAIFSVLFWDVSLVMESALNIFYLIMAVYGWWSWRYGGGQGRTVQPLPIQSWGMSQHVRISGAIVLLTLVSGFLLSRYTEAALPYLDSFTTWGAVITTWMVARKVLQNWLYWQVFNSAAIVLYIDRELYLTAVLMALYLVMAMVGWWRWKADYAAQQNDSDSDSGFAHAS